MADQTDPNYKPRGCKWCPDCGGLHPRRQGSRPYNFVVGYARPRL